MRSYARNLHHLLVIVAVFPFFIFSFLLPFLSLSLSLLSQSNQIKKRHTLYLLDFQKKTKKNGRPDPLIFCFPGGIS